MNNKKDFVTIKWIYRVSGRALWWTVGLMLIRALQGYISIAYAYGLKRVVDCAQAGMKEAFFQQFAFFAVLIVGMLALRAIGRYVLEKAQMALGKAFQLHTFSQLLRRDYAQITQVHTGEWMNRITSDTNVVSVAIATVIPEILGALVRMVGAAISLLQFAPQLVYILIPAGLLMGLFSQLIRRRVKGFHKKMQEADGRVRSFMQERLYSLLVVRAFSKETVTEKIGAERIDTFNAARIRRFHFTNFSSTVLATAMHGAQVLGIGLCGWGILQGQITYGTMSSVLYLINLLETPLTNISGYLAQYYAVLASAERLMEIEEFPLDVTAEPHSEAVIQQYYTQQFASLGLNDVTFGYEDAEEQTILRNFSMDIRKGEFVAFTGESGCGKSTTLKLLLNLYSLRSGEAYLRDIDGTQRTLDTAWRSLFAYVPQGNQVISGTIRETVAFSDPELMQQEDAIYNALRIACAEEFVRELPDGLDSVLGERGSGLSEGQMQRISVARAILSGRPILLLDEATSALDAATEKQMMENIRAMTDRTVLMITHREVTMDFCDKRIHFTQPEEITG